jgi:hypothetical protein
MAPLFAPRAQLTDASGPGTPTFGPPLYPLFTGSRLNSATPHGGRMSRYQVPWVVDMCVDSSPSRRSEPKCSTCLVVVVAVLLVLCWWRWC